MGIGEIREMNEAYKKSQAGLEAEYNKTGERDIMRYLKAYIIYLENYCFQASDTLYRDPHA